MDVRFGENGSVNSCQLIDNTNRGFPKGGVPSEKQNEENGTSGISK